MRSRRPPFRWLCIPIALALLAAAQTSSDRRLAPGQPRDFRIAPGERQTFTVTVQAGDFFHIAVEKKGIGLVLSILDPQGREVVSFQAPGSGFGSDHVSVIADQAGDYSVQLVNNTTFRIDGAGRIELAALRPPTDSDRARLRAEQLFRAAIGDERSPEPNARARAIESYTQAAALFDGLQDRAQQAASLARAGLTYYALRDYPQALRFAGQALDLRRAIGDRAGEASSVSDMGVMYYAQGDKAKALDHYNQGIRMARLAGDRVLEANSLNNLGILYGDSDDKRRALEPYSQAAAIRHAIDDRLGEANVHYSVGAIYSGLGEKPKALDAYTQALPLFRAAGEHAGEAAALGLLGTLNGDLGDKQKALDFYSQALALHRASGDRLGEGNMLFNIANIRRGMGETEKALELYYQAAPIYESIGRATDAADALDTIGDIYVEMQQRRKALESYQQALVARQAADDRDADAEAGTLGNIGFVLSALGEKQKALDFFSQALAMFRAAGDRSGEGTILGRLANAAADSGDRQTALDLYHQGLTIFRALHERAREADCLAGIAGVHTALQENKEAFDFFNQALAIYREIGSRTGEGNTLFSAGMVYARLGEPQKGLGEIGQALTILRAANDRTDEARALIGLAEIYSDLGQKQRAIELDTQSLTIYKALADPDGQATVLHDLGLFHDQLGDHEKALDYYLQALPMIRAVGDRPLEASLLNNLGLVYTELGDKTKAIDYYGQSYPLREAVGDRAGEAITLANIGLLVYSIGDRKGAFQCLMDGLNLARNAALPAYQGWILSALMSVWEQEHNPDLAIFFGKQAINQYQKIRKNIQDLDKDLQSSYLSTVTSEYRKLADLLISEGRLPEAERVLGMLKEQEFLQFTRGVTPGGAGAPLTLSPAETQAESITAEALEWFSLRGKDSRSAAEDARMAALSTKLSLASDAMTNYSRGLQQVLGKQAPGHARQIAMETSDSQSLLRDLPKGNGTVAVYTVVLEDELDLVVVSPAVMSPHKIPIKRADLSRRVQALLTALKNPASDPRRVAADLYSVIVAPIAADLKGAKADTIAWSLDDVLRYVPMNALYDDKSQRYLVEDFSNVLFNSANTSRLKDTPQLSQWTALAMGISKQYNADLPQLDGVPQELNAIVHDSRLPASNGPISGRILLDDAFTEKAMADQLWQKYPLVHIASHFVLDPASDDNSWLLLAGKDAGGEGYKLKLAELRRDVNLDFHAVELLTLSACETAVATAASDGREVDSLGLLAQEKGAKAVLATLWPANDAATSVLMADFYRRWTEAKGLRKIDALRQAQMAMLHGDHPHPYYWAPFLLMGNWQ